VQELDQARRHQGEIDEREVAVERADQRHKVQHLVGTAMVGKVEGDPTVFKRVPSGTRVVLERLA